MRTAEAEAARLWSRRMPEVAETVREIFQRMPERLNGEAAKGMNSVIQFNLAGNGGGSWYVEIKDGTCAVTEGAHPSPQMTLSVSASNYVDMVMGKLNAQTAFMHGKLKIAGDMSLAMKMQALFRSPAL